MTTPGKTSEDGSFARDAGTQTGKAVILILVAVLVAVVLLHHGSATTTVRTAKAATTTLPLATLPPTPSTTTQALTPPGQIKLLVLNGTGGGSLAGEFTTKLKADPGYNTLTPDDTTSKVQSSTVYAVSSQYTPEADFLAQYLKLPPSAVVTNLPSTAPIHSSEQNIAMLVLVIGPDLASSS